MIHLIYKTDNSQAFRELIEEDERIGKEVLFLEDDYSVGPLFDLYEDRRGRIDFWERLLGEAYDEEERRLYANPALADEETIRKARLYLGENEANEICFWSAENVIDVSASIGARAFFDKYADRIYQIHIDNLPFFSEEGRIFFPKYLSQISKEEIKKCIPLMRKTSAAEMDIENDMWRTLTSEKGEALRLEGARVLKSDTYAKAIDAVIKETLGEQKKEMKARKVVQYAQAQQRGRHPAFILWRIRALIEAGEVLAKESTNKKMSAFDMEIKMLSSLKEENI